MEIIFSLMKSGKLVDFIKRKKIFGVSGTIYLFILFYFILPHYTYNLKNKKKNRENRFNNGEETQRKL